MVGSIALAGLTLGLHLVSLHSVGGMQTFTPGLYVRTPAGFTAGAYRNSEGRGSAYAAWTFEALHGRVALTAGVVAGYRRHAIGPLLVPSVRLLGGDAAGSTALRLAWVPKPPRGHSHALHIALEREF
ncbi:MAG: hypothetical protein HS128_19300 [Ideonella sp.]|nr:hypothetical protein [Ideonella sp.]MCC7455962.1 hypothetical protein [Nitrospira sp.]